MKSANYWWEKLKLSNANVAVVCIPDIEEIQKDACEHGRLQGLRDSTCLCSCSVLITKVEEILEKHEQKP